MITSHGARRPARLLAQAALVGLLAVVPITTAVAPALAVDRGEGFDHNPPGYGPQYDYNRPYLFPDEGTGNGPDSLPPETACPYPERSPGWWQNCAPPDGY